ncbi:hypothetical protein EKI60_05825 [Candidatus Saccharibacteria bacterium]|nr:MAG: hypothetical protein EKI60_05825 [Candidatus Saccharibacteria bacterium]
MSKITKDIDHLIAIAEDTTVSNRTEAEEFISDIQRLFDNVGKVAQTLAVEHGILWTSYFFRGQSGDTVWNDWDDDWQSSYSWSDSGCSYDDSDWN